MYIGLRVKYTFCGQILIKLEFLARFSKNPPMSNFMKIHALVAELFHADGQADKYDE